MTSSAYLASEPFVVRDVVSDELVHIEPMEGGLCRLTFSVRKRMLEAIGEEPEKIVVCHIVASQSGIAQFARTMCFHLAKANGSTASECVIPFPARPQ